MAEEEKVETTEAADTKAAKKGKKKWPSLSVSLLL